MQEVSGVFQLGFLVFLMKQSKKRRRNHPGKLMAKSRSQPVNLLGAGPLMSPLVGLIAGQSLYFCLTAALWCFVDSYAQRADARKALQQDKTWINSYIKKMLKMLVKQVHLSLRFKKKISFYSSKDKVKKGFFSIFMFPLAVHDLWGWILLVISLGHAFKL